VNNISEVEESFTSLQLSTAIILCPQWLSLLLLVNTDRWFVQKIALEASTPEGSSVNIRLRG